eukprot:scaffold102_cov133-Isochrysis_galbana.AAC.5
MSAAARSLSSSSRRRPRHADRRHPEHGAVATREFSESAYSFFRTKKRHTIGAGAATHWATEGPTTVRPTTLPLPALCPHPFFLFRPPYAGDGPWLRALRTTTDNSQGLVSGSLCAK